MHRLFHLQRQGRRRPVFQAFCPAVPGAHRTVRTYRSAVQPLQNRTHSLAARGAQPDSAQWRGAVEAGLRPLFPQVRRRRPGIHRKHRRQAVWLTSELFEFKPLVEPATGEITGHQLCVGTRKHPVDVLAFKAHQAYQPLMPVVYVVAVGRPAQNSALQAVSVAKD